MFPVVAAFEYGVWRILCKRTRYLLLAHAHIFLRGTATAHMRSNFKTAAGKISSSAPERISFQDSITNGLKNFCETRKMTTLLAYSKREIFLQLHKFLFLKNEKDESLWFSYWCREFRIRPYVIIKSAKAYFHLLPSAIISFVLRKG